MISDYSNALIGNAGIVKLVKEVASLGGDITGLVPDNVADKIKAKYR